MITVIALLQTGAKNETMTAALTLLKCVMHVVVRCVARKDIKMVKKWINSRIEERTSWDGAMLIGVGLVILIAGPFAKLAAYIAIAYGAWTIYKSE